MFTQRCPKIHDVWATLDSRCTDVACSLGCTSTCGYRAFSNAWPHSVLNLLLCTDILLSLCFSFISVIHHMFLLSLSFIILCLASQSRDSEDSGYTRFRWSEGKLSIYSKLNIVKCIFLHISCIEEYHFRVLETHTCSPSNPNKFIRRSNTF